MTFAQWQELAPAAAAREIHQRVRSRLSSVQQRAVVAFLRPESEIAADFAGAAPGSPLGRIPFFAKDLFDVGGVPTFGGSAFLPEVRLTRAADGAFVKATKATGAVLAGKTQMHEFAYGVTGENPTYGDCESPRAPGRTTGGSSSGSAAVVAAGIAPLALGSDTGCSVRLPAAFCGIYGFRLMPRDPWISDALGLATTFDTAGWFTDNAPDMRTAIGALVGLRTSQREPRGCYLEMPGLDPDVATACHQAASRFAEPAEPFVRDDLLHGFGPARDSYNTITAIEAWEVHQGWAEKYQDRYDLNVWQRLTRVRSITPAQIADADLGLATIRMLWTKFFLTYDFLILAATPFPAMTKAECTFENRMRILTLNAPASIGGLPVLTVPVTLPSGLTTGLQIIVNSPQSPVVNWVLGRC
jgi:amidase/aspartyl-tRNA(Asn)/glutamyl-tRNA(Gln) amidotransferase subunit A